MLTPVPDPGREFIGRQREIDALQAALDAAVNGRPGIVLLAGEPGIGKTRTAQQIADHAASRHVLALWGRCPEEPGAPPYWPWLQLIRRYVALHDAAVVEATLGRAGALIAALDPELAARLNVDATPPAVESDAPRARFRLFDAIAGFWRRAAARQPLLLVIDDLHRADVASLRLLEFVIAEADASRLLVLGTYRDGEVTRSHPLSDTLAELNRAVKVQRLLLGGFSAAETARFLAAATGAESLETASALHDQTAGHPLFLSELARDLPRAGSSGTRQPPGHVPRGVRDVIGARLNRLTPHCIGVLQSAAVFGREFRLDLLCRLFDELPEEQVQGALDEARIASLVGELAEPGHHQFTHALVRDTLYDELPARRRAELHRRIGAAFEDRYAPDLSGCLSVLAYHCHAAGPAGDAAKAIEYATRAAEQATAMQAHEEAARHYRHAGATLPTGPDTDAQRCRLLLGLGGAENSAGLSAQALTTFAAATECARRVGDASLLARSALGFADAQWRLGIEGSQAAALIHEALAHPAAHDIRERCALLGALCQTLLFSNRPDEAETAFREAVAIARRLDEPMTLFRALCAILPGRWFSERLALRVEVAREALELVQRAGHPEWAVPYLTGWHTGDLMELGDTVAATATARFHLATGETRREPFNEAVALAALAMIATHEGRFAEAETLAADALRRGQRFDRANAAGIFGVQMFTLRRHQGRLGELAPVLERLLDSASHDAMWRPGLAVLYRDLGAREPARALFENLCVGEFAGIANDAIRIASIAYLAEVCAWLDDKDRASTLFTFLLPYTGRNIVFGAHTASFGAADRPLGMLAATLERWDLAQHHFERAIAIDERTGGRPWLARSRFEFAAMLLRRAGSDDAARAGALLEAALDEARTLGLRGLEASVLALQQQAADDLAPESTVAGLSRREVQVLRLVAAGKTNQEIADALFRSPNTIANHVRSILGKTGSANRAEASAFAVRHGLLAPE